MQLYTFDPTSDSRWDSLVASHPDASVFHHKGWLTALAKTYGFRPLVLTSSPSGKPLKDGIVFCEIKSWITGTRLVSLPFVDHLEPLLNETGGSFEPNEWMQTACRTQGWKYIELRPLSWETNSHSLLVPSQAFWIHTLDLTPSLDKIFHGLHKNCIQRRIRRAENERLSYESGCSDRLLNDFYRLLLITRKRHRLLPQPRAWFRNLIAAINPDVEIRLARKDGTPIAAILTLRYRGSVVYKYGCSDERFHHIAAMPFLFWKLIEESKASGANQIDFGRTDIGNTGLITFKDRFGTTRRQLNYYRYPESAKGRGLVASDFPAVRRLLSVLPGTLLSVVGDLAYRHVG